MTLIAGKAVVSSTERSGREQIVIVLEEKCNDEIRRIFIVPAHLTAETPRYL